METSGFRHFRSRPDPSLLIELDMECSFIYIQRCELSISVVYVRPLAKKSVFKRTDPLDSHLLLLRGSCVSRSHHHPVGLKKGGKEKRESARESEKCVSVVNQFS